MTGGVRRLAVVWLSALCLAACGGNTKTEGAGNAPTEPPACVTTDEVMAVYGLYIKGDYEAYANEMQQCDGKPEEYRRQMAWLYKQHAADKRRTDGELVTAKVGRITPCNNGFSADVFLNVTYANRDTEEIYLQFVYDGDRWRLR